MYPKPIRELIESFKTLPNIGDKTAERLVMHLANRKSFELENFAQNIINVSAGIHECKVCHFITDEDICIICSDEKRDKEVICVVETIRDVVVLEKLKMFKGKYHVLNGAISPMNGVGIEDLNISSLISRVRNTDEVKELIIATNPTIDGEATANYISKLLENTGIVVSRIAHGLPVGSDLEYADELTLFKALEGRKNI
ncbi:MAG: recombination mediator RecR [Bacilli bacterium]